MGDTGSQFLGFSAVIFALELTQGSTPLSPLLPLIIFGFPVLDTVFVMSRRLREGRSPFSADQNHFHHRLMRLGLFQTESVLLIYVLQAGLMILALFLRFHSEWLLLGGYLVFAGILAGVFILADRTGFRLNRSSHLFDRVVKGKLRELRENGAAIRIFFRVIEFGIPGLLLFSCFLPASVPRFVSYLSLAWIGLIALAWPFPRKYRRLALTAGLYLFIPYVIYAGSTDALSWVTENLVKYYNLSFSSSPRSSSLPCSSPGAGTVSGAPPWTSSSSSLPSWSPTCRSWKSGHTSSAS